MNSRIAPVPKTVRKRPLPETRADVIADKKVCQWLGGEIGHDEFCDNEKRNGESFCQEHLNRVYRPYTRRRNHHDEA